MGPYVGCCGSSDSAVEVFAMAGERSLCLIALRYDHKSPKSLKCRRPRFKAIDVPEPWLCTGDHHRLKFPYL